MRIAFDTGGTFTDCVFLRGGRLEIRKVPSTPRKPSEAIAHALDRIRESGVERAGLELVKRHKRAVGMPQPHWRAALITNFLRRGYKEH